MEPSQGPGFNKTSETNRVEDVLANNGCLVCREDTSKIENLLSHSFTKSPLHRWSYVRRSL